MPFFVPSRFWANFVEDSPFITALSASKIDSIDLLLLAFYALITHEPDTNTGEPDIYSTFDSEDDRR